MSKTFTSRLVLAVALAAAAVGAQASVLGARDPYSDGARAVQSARDVFSEGARSATRISTAPARCKTSAARSPTAPDA